VDQAGSNGRQQSYDPTDTLPATPNYFSISCLPLQGLSQHSIAQQSNLPLPYHPCYLHPLLASHNDNSLPTLVLSCNTTRSKDYCLLQCDTMQLVAMWQHLGEPAAMLHTSIFHIFWTTRHVNLSCSDGLTDTPSDCTIQANFIHYCPGKYALWSGNYGA
jgi:hypothetical protein